MRLIEQPIISANEIAARVDELAREIEAAYAEPIVMIAVLKGALPFAADLARAIRRPLELDFVRARSYRGTLSTGTVELTMVPEIPLRGRHVLLLEDILDTGLTAAAIFDHISALGPESLAFCTLLDKPERRRTNVRAQFTGFTIPGTFVVGYGMDYNEQYRNLPAIHELLP